MTYREEWLTVKEYAERLRLRPKSVYRAIRRGELHAMGQHRQTRVCLLTPSAPAPARSGPARRRVRASG